MGSRGEAQASAAAGRGWGTASWRALGTWAHVLVTDPAALAPARAAVVQVLDEVDLACSRFRDDSELVRLCRAADGQWQPVGPVLARALRIALDAASWTGGSVDPTAGRSLVDLGYDRTFRELPADGPAVTAHRPPGWREVELDGDRVRLPRGLLLDLGATAKGHAADLAAHAAAAATGGTGVLVSFGGDLRVAGPSPDGGWPVELDTTADPDLPPAADPPLVLVTSGGLATSSTTARRWRRGGQTLHHVLDPASGRPAEPVWQAVTVAAATCALANAAATCAIVRGRTATSWLDGLQVVARLVRDDGVVTTTGGWPI